MLDYLETVWSWSVIAVTEPLWPLVRGCAAVISPRLLGPAIRTLGRGETSALIGQHWPSRPVIGRPDHPRDIWLCRTDWLTGSLSQPGCWQHSCALPARSSQLARCTALTGSHFSYIGLIGWSQKVSTQTPAMAEGEINIDNIIQRLLEGENLPEKFALQPAVMWLNQEPL